METKIIKCSDLTAKNWAGGTTTQIFIYPEDTEYTKFNFTFRLSTATVEIEETEFTFMPGVTRHLIILDGNLWLNHRNRYSVQLNTLSKDVFDGEWPTNAKGKVRDFNLMTRNGANASCVVISMNSGESQNLISENDYAFVYVIDGDVEFTSNQKLQSLSKGDTLIIHSNKIASSLSIKCLNTSQLIFGSIRL